MDDWQMQCCGKPFAVGHEVSWTLRAADHEWVEHMLGAEMARRTTMAEEHHGDLPDETPPTTGRVESIDAVHCRYAPRPGENALYPVAGSGVLTPIESADGWTPNNGELRFAGYIIELNLKTDPNDPR